MPVQDILANIQRAIDTGNVEAAFIDTAGLEDDSERKSQVSQEYDIDESTLNAYTEQLQTTGELARQHEELADALEQSKRSFGEGSEEVKEARNALAALNQKILRLIWLKPKKVLSHCLITWLSMETF